MLSLYISNFLMKCDMNKFPFGNHIVEPLVVCFKSFVIGALCLYSFIGAIKDIIAGGNNIEYGSAFVYSIISSIGCLLVFLYMKKRSKKLSSQLIKAESTQWLMDSVLSTAVLIGFIVAIILSFTKFNIINKYIDPLMVLLSSTIFIRYPIKSFIDSFKEVISIKADDKINEHIYVAVKEIENEYKFEESITRVSKVGRALRIEIDFVYNSNSNLKNLDEMDKVREKINNKIKNINYNKWLNISFTGDKKWAL